MKTSVEGRKFIQGFESCKLKAYLDGGGVWTIGVGHTGPGARKGNVWTQEQADEAFANDLSKFEQDVTAMVKVPLTQNQFDALVSFAFNCGSQALKGSTLLRKLNTGDYEGAANEFLRWDKDNGKVVKGLSRRRLAEKIVFLK